MTFRLNEFHLSALLETEALSSESEYIKLLPNQHEETMNYQR